MWISFYVFCYDFHFCNKRFCTITSGQNLFGRLQKESSLLFSYFSPFPLHKVYRVFLHFCAFSTNVFTQASERFQAAFGGDGLCHSWETTWWGKARNGGLLSASSPKSSFMIIMIIIKSLSWFGLGQSYSFISFPNMLIPSSRFSYFHNSTWYIQFWNSNLWESHADKLGREIQRCSHLTNPTVQTSHKQNKIS